MEKNIESFYNRNVEDYFQKTWELDLKEIYEKFLRYVPSGRKFWMLAGLAQAEIRII